MNRPGDKRRPYTPFDDRQHHSQGAVRLHESGLAVTMQSEAVPLAMLMEACDRVDARLRAIFSSESRGVSTSSSVRQAQDDPERESNESRPRACREASSHPTFRIVTAYSVVRYGLYSGTSFWISSFT
jgi:hypothetical protein